MLYTSTLNNCSKGRVEKSLRRRLHTLPNPIFLSNLSLIGEKCTDLDQTKNFISQRENDSLFFSCLLSSSRLRVCWIRLNRCCNQCLTHADLKLSSGILHRFVHERPVECFLPITGFLSLTRSAAWITVCE